MPTTEPYDVADYLTDDETILAYLEEALDTNEPRLVASAIGAVVRARSRTVEHGGSGSNSLVMLSALLREGEGADLKTIFQALDALGLKLTPARRVISPLAA